MNSDALQSLIISRTLLVTSEPLCRSENRYEATAGLILLQDAIEAFLYSTLLEVSVNNEIKLEKKGFDELIGELNKLGITIKNQHRLKLLNKQRVLAKHYAQIVEPTSASHFFQTSIEAIEDLMQRVFSMHLHEISIAEVIVECEAKQCLRAADAAIRNGEYLVALIEIRKSIYLEFEQDYNLADWKDYDERTYKSVLSTLGFRGFKCHSYKRNREWISKYVKSPTDYLQVNHDAFRFTALEFGFSFEEYLNLIRHSPVVYRNNDHEQWHINIDSSLADLSENRNITLYCLDTASLMIAKKQRYSSQIKSFGKIPITLASEASKGKSIFEKPDAQSAIVGEIDIPSNFLIARSVTGFDSGWYDYVISLQDGPVISVGYIMSEIDITRASIDKPE